MSPTVPTSLVPLPADAVPAPFGRRAFARLFDVFVVGLFAVPMLALTVQEDGPDASRFPWIMVAAYAILPALGEAYALSTRGTTPGKRLSGLIVCDGGNVPPRFVPALLRSLLTWSLPALSVLLWHWSAVIGVLVAVYGPAVLRGRDLADLLAGTRVMFIGDLTDHNPT